MVKVLRIILLAILLVLAGTTVFYSVTKTLEAAGGIDFHSYWYSGHFLRQGIDPYRAYLDGLIPDPYVSYLDSTKRSEGAIAQPGLANVPANTAPVVIALSALAFFTWPTAKLLWLAINLLLMFVIPGMVIRLLPSDRKLDIYTKVVIYLAFLGMFGTRNIAGNGQTSLLIFAFMLLALLSMRRSWLEAGVWLGLALSKYSLSLPVFIYFIVKKQYRAAVTGLVVQALASALLGALTHTSPAVIVYEYLQILGVHTNLPGIQLGSLFPGPPFVGIAATVAMTLIVFMALLVWLRRFSSRLVLDAWLEQFSGNHLMAALMLWTLLVAYHRAYDSFVAILFFAMVIYGLSGDVRWRLISSQKKALAIGSVLAYVPLSLPARGITFIARAIPDESLARWLDFQGALLTLTLLGLLAATLWLLYRITMVEAGGDGQDSQPD
jgi:hypothetical protein